MKKTGENALSENTLEVGGNAMKKQVFILPAVTAVMAMFFACHFEQQPETLYAIGDIGPSGVGIVFYVTDDGLHGLEVAPIDQSENQVWIEGGSTQTTENGNTSFTIGAGLANSDAIMAQPGHTGSAAKVCRDYAGGGKTDWFLPSFREMDELYSQRATVGGFDLTLPYWSSYEFNVLSAHTMDFNNGASTAFGKISHLRVRAIRAF